MCGHVYMQSVLVVLCPIMAVTLPDDRHSPKSFAACQTFDGLDCTAGLQVADNYSLSTMGRIGALMAFIRDRSTKVNIDFESSPSAQLYSTGLVKMACSETGH